MFTICSFGVSNTLNSTVVSCLNSSSLLLRTNANANVFFHRVSFRKKKTSKNVDTVPGKDGDVGGPSPAGDSKPTEESRDPDVSCAVLIRWR